MTSQAAWKRRLTFRYDEFIFYRDKFMREGNPVLLDAAVDHARALWSIALRMTAADRADYLARTD